MKTCPQIKERRAQRVCVERWPSKGKMLESWKLAAEDLVGRMIKYFDYFHSGILQ